MESPISTDKSESPLMNTGNLKPANENSSTLTYLDKELQLKRFLPIQV